MRARGFVVASVAIAITGCDHPKPPPPPPATSQAASQPTSKPATKPVEPHKPPATLLDVVRLDDRSFPSTQPLAEPIELEAAARLTLKEPVYLCSRGDLWITRPDALPTADVLATASKSQTHAVRERVEFVYWRPGPTSAELVVREGDHDVWVTKSARLPLDASRQRDWSRAMLWNSNVAQSVVVPCANGMSILTVPKDASKVDEQFVPLLDAASPGSGTFAALDPRGILAWSVKPGGDSTVARFLDGKWTTLTPSPAWPSQLLHVVPFEDGTVLAIARDGDDIKLRSVLLDPIPVDEAKVMALVAKLANPNPETREQAQADLSRIGPGAWPILTKIRSAQPAEARVRIGAVLGDQQTPTLGGVRPEEGPGRLVARLNDGGVILYFSAGASAVHVNGNLQTTTPAWLAVRPTQLVRALPASLIHDLDPIAGQVPPLKTWGDEWILEHDVDGPMRWMGNHNEPLTKRPKERDFQRFVGIDANGRWIVKTIDPNGPTLIIDPTLPDPRPRLPVWTVDVGSGSVGWTDDNWPAMKRGGAWTLKESSWAAIPRGADPEATPFHTSIDPTSQPSTEPDALLTDAAGNRYGGGMTSITIHRPDGSTIDWPLPDEACGVADTQPTMIEADGKLFLWNAPGRLIRLTPQFDQLGVDPSAAPLKFDAAFSHNLPATDIRRIWKDPAGRIVIATSGHRLSIAFPSGRINGEMANMIPAGQLKDAFAGESEPAK